MDSIDLQSGPVPEPELEPELIHEESLDHSSISSPLSLYPDLIFNQNFLISFASLVAVYSIIYPILRMLCYFDLPDNCGSVAPPDSLQSLLAAVERIFLLVALGDFSLLCRANWKSRISMLFIVFLSALLSTIALSDRSIRAGFSAGRVLTGLAIFIFLASPLIFGIFRFYSKAWKLRAVAILSVYLIFLFANLINQKLHVHHWTWGFIYSILLYTTIVKENQQNSGSVAADRRALPIFSYSELSKYDRIFFHWSRAALMVAVGICFEGLAAYGSRYYFIGSADASQ